MASPCTPIAKAKRADHSPARGDGDLTGSAASAASDGTTVGGIDDQPSAKKKSKKRAKPSIDLDNYIKSASEAMRAAQKQVNACKAMAKNERRKKQRLVKKAAALSPSDLERIATLKRCGFAGDTTLPPRPAATSAASSGDNPGDQQKAVGLLVPGLKQPEGTPSAEPPHGTASEDDDEPQS